jgi:hypothetical protein
MRSCAVKQTVNTERQKGMGQGGRVGDLGPATKTGFALAEGAHQLDLPVERTMGEVSAKCTGAMIGLISNLPVFGTESMMN